MDLKKRTWPHLGGGSSDQSDPPLATGLPPVPLAPINPANRGTPRKMAVRTESERCEIQIHLSSEKCINKLTVPNAHLFSILRHLYWLWLTCTCIQYKSAYSQCICAALHGYQPPRRPPTDFMSSVLQNNSKLAFLTEQPQVRDILVLVRVTNWTRICAAEMAVRYAALCACRKVHMWRWPISENRSFSILDVRS